MTFGDVSARTFRPPRNDLTARGASSRRGELGEPVSEGDHTPRTVLRRLGPILAICRSARRARARSVLGAGSATSAALLIGRRAKAAPPRPDPHGLPRSLRQRRTDEAYGRGGHGVTPTSPRSGRSCGGSFAKTPLRSNPTSAVLSRNAVWATKSSWSAWLKSVTEGSLAQEPGCGPAAVLAATGSYAHGSRRWTRRAVV